ncbi:MAG TPA: hypothetical protein PKD09_20440 [Aggregatilinea sp.]|uniref:hypothetical protein n=1 Tax=Aggregatilinea sp. TaxID=2806333 RepID=UPI002BA4099B|nr:hypothetical protein [Aggregatilinea sp.]HML24037.1 hypothetical protein [Aggregatilinea sp.]
MINRGYRLLSLLCALAVLGALLPPAAHAQESGTRYEDPALGIAFDLPAGWEVETQDRELYAATRADLDAILAGGAPGGLALRVVVGTFNELGLSDAAQLPDLLNNLVTHVETPPAPEPVQVAGGTGYQIVFTLPNDGLTTRVLLLEVAGGRVAVIRGLAPSAAWDGGASATFDALLQSMQFASPEQPSVALDQIMTDDGGAIWLYQPDPASIPNARAGGITYDLYGALYMAAGPAGVITLDISSGAQISLMGPWIDSADYADVAIGPDTRLYLANAAVDATQAVVIVDRAGNYGRGWGVRGDADGQFAPGMPRTIAVTKGGDIWTVSEGHASGARNRLYKFDLYGNLLVSVDLDTVDPSLSGIRIDNNIDTGALYLVGAGGSLTVLDTNGQALARDLADSVLAGQTITDVAIAPNDDIMLSLAAPGLDGQGFLELTMSGRLVDAFGVPYDTTRGGAFLPGEYLHPAGLVVTPDGMPLWSETTDAGITQVQAFTFAGDGALPPAGSDIAASDVQADSAASTDTGGVIAPGQTVRGSLDNNVPVQEWLFEGTAGQKVVITMIDASGQGALDPLINLVDVNSRTIASNDDMGSMAVEGMSTHDARLEFALPSTGTYTIEAARFGGRGDYTLTLEVVQ